MPMLPWFSGKQSYKEHIEVEKNDQFVSDTGDESSHVAWTLRALKTFSECRVWRSYTVVDNLAAVSASILEELSNRVQTTKPEVRSHLH